MQHDRAPFVYKGHGAGHDAWAVQHDPAAGRDAWAVQHYRAYLLYTYVGSGAGCDAGAVQHDLAPSLSILWLWC